MRTTVGARFAVRSRARFDALVAACACALVAAVASGCDDGPKPAAAALDCGAVLRRMRAPHLVAVLDDGSLVPGPACASANCLAGANDVFAWHEGDVIHATVGARTLDVPTKKHSPLSATASLSGLAVADDALTVDRGGTIDVYGADGTTLSLPMPPLPPKTRLGAVHLVAGGATTWIAAPRSDNTGSHRIILAPFANMPPDAASPVRDLVTRAHVGWLVPGDDASVLALDGTRTPLHVAIGVDDGVTKLADAWLVNAPLRTFLLRHGKQIDVPHGMQLSTSSSTGPFGVTCGPPFAIENLVDDAWHPLYGGPDRDLAGTALPPNASIERLSAAVHGARVLAIERVQLDLCGVEDRVFLVDVDQHTVKRLDQADDRAKLHPTWAGDRFRYVEADVDLSQP